MAGIYLLLTTVLFWASENEAGKTMKMVHVIYRHGARSPLFFYPTDKHQAKDWPGGAGRLTPKGMNLEYDLGKFLKERYMINTSFVSQPYIHTQVYIRSTDVDRCLQSAETQLAGLYPPKGYQVWNTQIPWQPIPVHTVPKPEDTLLRPGDVYCPRLQVLWNKKKTTPEYKKKLEENKDLLVKLTNFTGMKVNFNNLWKISDALICEKTQGMELAEWATNLSGKVHAIANWLFINNYKGDDELGRLLGGTLLAKINNNMEKFSKGQELESLFKLNMFSGHDTTLFALSTALNVDIDVPVFASCILIELYHSPDTGYFIEMHHRNDYSGHLIPLKLKKCAFSCPLNDFLKLTKKRTTEDRSKLCSVGGKGLFNATNLQILLVVFFGSAMLLFLIIISLCFIHRTSLKVRFGYKQEVQLNDEEDKLMKSTETL